MPTRAKCCTCPTSTWTWRIRSAPTLTAACPCAAWTQLPWQLILPRPQETGALTSVISPGGPQRICFNTLLRNIRMRYQVISISNISVCVLWLCGTTNDVKQTCNCRILSTLCWLVTLQLTTFGYSRMIKTTTRPSFTSIWSRNISRAKKSSFHLATTTPGQWIRKLTWDLGGIKNM